MVVVVMVGREGVHTVPLTGSWWTLVSSRWRSSETPIKQWAVAVISDRSTDILDDVLGDVDTARFCIPVFEKEEADETVVLVVIPLAVVEEGVVRGAWSSGFHFKCRRINAQSRRH